MQWDCEECQDCRYNEMTWALLLTEQEQAKRELFDPLEDS